MMRPVLAILLWVVFVAAAVADDKSPAAVGDAATVDAASFDQRIEKTDREHWSFQPVRRPPIPTVTDASWARNPVDSFILARLEQKGWRPSPPAEARALLRRMYLDVIGLPPTPLEQIAFLAAVRAWGLDAAADREVDRLLARPEYGEHWARHWLDVVRYAESNGYERDAIKPHVWRYRDWAVRGLNGDKPYDRFVLEQVAGDELPDANAESIIATGFWRLGHWDDEPADPAEDRFDQLDDMVSTAGQAFLALTIGCARCHDHKFEPLSQLDYYRMAAIVSPLKRPQKGRDDLDAPAGSRAELAALAKRDGQIAVISAEIAALRAVPSLVASAPRIALLRRQMEKLRAETPDPPRAYFLHEPGPKSADTHLLRRGKASSPGPVVAPGVPAVLVEWQPEFLPPDEHTSRRRLTFARWLTDPRHPLTARVVVNRVWQRHFGMGIVRSPNDFGVVGDEPTHPELLDWMADKFMADGWSLKKLHRLILTSGAYRMSAASNPRYAAADPENKLLWRAAYRRLEVEAIRDSMLAVSGRLNGRMYGPSMHPFVPREVLTGHSDPDKIWPAYNEREASRRTVYAQIKRSMVVPMLEVLDLCDTTRSTGRRDVTSVAPQALTLFNGHFVNEQARHFAARLMAEAGGDAAGQIDRAFNLALCRPPTVDEMSILRTFLNAQAVSFSRESAGRKPAPLESAAGRRKALEQMCRVIFNLNEFVYPD